MAIFNMALPVTMEASVECSLFSYSVSHVETIYFGCLLLGQSELGSGSKPLTQYGFHHYDKGKHAFPPFIYCEKTSIPRRNVGVQEAYRCSDYAFVYFYGPNSPLCSCNTIKTINLDEHYPVRNETLK